jgi:hypothetical protein
MYRKAMIRRKVHAQIVCTILMDVHRPMSAAGPAELSKRSDTPSVASSRKDSCGNPPPEDEEGKAAQDEGAEPVVNPVFPLFVGFDIGLLASSQNRGVINWGNLF